MINGHGDDLHQYDNKIEHNFSSNVYYKGCPPSLINKLQNTFNHIENYPSPLASELNLLAADYFKLDKGQFLFTNGATEAFYLIAQNSIGKTATIVRPTFSEYEDACRINKVETQYISWNEIETAKFTTDLAFICNPNNPNGFTLSKPSIKRTLQAFPNTHFIIDEAYIEFTNVIESALPLIKNYKNLSIVRSLTKTFAIPGLRLGYLVTNSDYINQLLKIKMPWTVNSMSIEAGKFIFNNYSSLSFDVSTLLNETKEFKTAIDNIDYLEVVPGSTTYFLVKLKKGKAADLKKYLIEFHQILIRDATNFNGLEGQYIRLSVQSKSTNALLIAALKKWN